MSLIESIIPSVHDTLTLREALSKLAQCERLIKTQGATSIVENFNIIYSCLYNIRELKSETIHEIFSMLTKGVTILESELKKTLNEKLPNDVRDKYLTTIKIFIHFTIEFVNFEEKKQQSSKDNDLMPTNSKKGAASKKKTGQMDISVSSANDWIETREKILDGISRLVQLNIQKLWDPPIVEEQFVILITNYCYKLMENLQNNNLRAQQKKTLKDLICLIVALMIKKYNHSYGACVMIMQTLPHYEHLSAVYADLIHICVTQLGYESILPDILREFRHQVLTLGNGASTGKEKENPNMKYYSQFLIDLVARLAPNIIPYLSLIQDFLEDESYLMRHAILFIYGELIVKVLNQAACTNDLKLKEMRNELLDTLCDHIHDVNAVARSKTLQIWRNICSENAIPLQYTNEVMKRCIGRMEDSSSSVRKSAFQLLCDLIRTNPFGIKCVEMNIDQVEAELEKEEAHLHELNIQLSELNEDESQEGEEDEQARDVHSEEKKEKFKKAILVQQTKVNYLKDMSGFLKQIESAIPQISRLLFSKVQTDVLEVISFFVTCYEHGINGMLVGVRKMLSLILYAEKTIRDAVVDAYKRLYLTADDNANVGYSLQVVRKLLKLVQDLTVCERAALEELIGEFAETSQLGKDIISTLWEIFCSPEQDKQNRLNSLILLGMIIKKVPNRGKANIQVLVDYGLDANFANEAIPEMASDLDMLRFSETCLALSYISPDTSTKQLTQLKSKPLQDGTNKNKEKKGRKNASDSTLMEDSSQPTLVFSTEPFKLLNNHVFFETIQGIILTQLTNLKSVYYTPMVENAIHAIFKLADNPILILQSMLIKLIDKTPVFKSISSLAQLPPVPLFGESQQPSQVTQEPNLNMNTSVLSRFFTIIGIVAYKLLIFLNQFVVCELKRRKMCKENQINNGALGVAKKTSKSNRRKSMKAKSIANQTSDTLEEEMGLQGAEAEDVELMFVESVMDQKVSQTQVMKSGSATVNSFLGQILPSIVFILKEPLKFNDEILQLSCSLTLVRLMLLSQKWCTQNLQLLFTLIEKSNNSNLRSRIIIGVGDLVYRFPNALEPWTNHLYMPLRDTKSNEVRMNTIRVLSHLILKEMIKTRGQIYEIAICTIDPDPQISALAKLFFEELSQRNNGLVIYNAMPDIISQLTGGTGTATDEQSTRAIEEDSFKKIASYLFTFIKRDKQCETLIEKLCVAFRQANIKERKCRDLAFCLSKIQLSESGIKKLKETFKFYADKLSIQEVYDTFKTVIKNARKIANLKNETKSLLDEFENDIDKAKTKGVDDENPATNNNEENNNNNGSDSDEPVQSIPLKPSQTNNKKQAAMSRSRIEKGSNAKKANSKGSNSKGAKKRVVIESSDDDSSQSSSDSDSD